ncbi:MAG: phosphopyruvate hydratase [Chthoniobacterales bacterium]
MTQLDALEILDSRGRPTLAVTVGLDGRVVETVSVPSGASTGKAEAKELRDQDKRYRGLGTRKAVANVCGLIASALVGREFADQDSLDRVLIELDGTPDKSRLGANAILATSLAFARASARLDRVELFQYFASLIANAKPAFPQLTVNLFSGGKHAFGQVAIQDVLVVPIEAANIADSLAIVYEVYQSAAELVFRKYDSRALTADEGGLAPPFRHSSEMLESAAEAIEEAGFRLGKEVALAIDVAASHFMLGQNYHLDGENEAAEGVIDKIDQWVKAFPIVSVEDGLAEDDWDNWPKLRSRLEGWALTLADDLTCTNPDRIRRAIGLKAANALLLKLNQIGTLTEAREAYRIAREAGWQVSMSARSGETEDHWLADLAVGWSGDFIKVGSITQSERLAKYNRLLRIEHDWRLPRLSATKGGQGTAA